MKNQKLLMGILAVLVLITGIVVYKVALAPKPPATVVEDEEDPTILPQVESTVVVEAVESKTKDNTVILSVKGLNSKYTSVGYELTYDSQGLIKGVNSGSKPIDVAGKDSFEREVYLGTCSRNVCKPDAGVTKVSVVMEFTDTAGKKSQFSKDYDL